MHTNIQRQQQKEQRGDLEIKRNITAKETSEMEHKAQTQERVVQGKVVSSLEGGHTGRGGGGGG